MSGIRAVRRIAGVAFAALALALFLSAAPRAAELDMPVPNGVVYPGDSPLQIGVRDRSFRVKDSKLHLYVTRRTVLENQVARRTLIAGRPIRRSDLEPASAVEAGAKVSLIYRDGGLVITGTGTALESAGPGESVRVRNADSGRTVAGRVGHDGSVSVNR